MAYISQITPLGSSTTYDLKAAMLTHTPNNTTTFLRGDNTWSNTLTGNLLLSKDANTEWTNAPQLQLIGADSKIAAIKLTNSGTNLDIGWDWTARTGAGLGLRSTSSTDTAGGFYLFARNATENHELVGTAGGDLTWSGLLKITNNSNTTTIGSQNTTFCHIYNSANIPFIFNNSVLTTGGNLGDSTYPFDNLTLGRSNGAGIYYKGTKATSRMIRFIDNTSDIYGNGIAIGGGGQTIIGGGESADTAAAQAGTAGAEIMQVCNDGKVELIANLQNGWDDRKVLSLNTDGYLWCPSYINVPTGNNENPTISQFIVTNGSDNFYRKASAAHAMAAIRSNASGSWGINITGNAATASNADKLDNLDSLDFLRNFHTNAAVGNIDTFNTTNYFYAHGDEGGFASGTNPGGHNGTAILNAHTHSGNYYTQLGLDTARNALWIRSANNSSTFGNWLQVVTNSGTWGISITGNAATATTAGGVNTTTPVLATATESNAITVIDLGNNVPATNQAQRHALDFKWYNSHWAIGNLRTGTSTSAGFGFSYSPDGTNWANKLIIGTNGSITIGHRETATSPSSATSSTRLTIIPYFHTGGPWTINSVDDSTNAYLTIKYGSSQITSLRHDGYMTAVRVYGAVWNDYAEYRKDNPNEIQEPGRCVRELGNGALALTTKRLERGCEIISDTFGFAIGQDEEKGYNTPIASNGRVLAYPYESIKEFANHIGWPVCSGPNGTVSIMTEEEEEKYPSRIIGTISEIPTYEIWGTGNVKVNGRVWIRIR